MFAQYLVTFLILFFRPGCSGAALLGPLRGRNSCCLWFWQLVFGVSLRDATSNLPSSPNPFSNRSVLHEGRKHKTVVSSQPNALREEARRTNLPLLAIGCHADCSGERRTSPFNGTERSLSRADVIKTMSLPVSATTFATSLSLCIAHYGRKHILQISSNFALARSLSANQGREIAQNRNIDPRDSVVKDLTASRWSKHRGGSWRSHGAWGHAVYLRTCSEGSKSTC